MKTIQADEITEVVSELCKKACYHVTPDMRAAFEKARENEASSIGKDILGKLLQNADLAAKEVAPICQDTGMAVVFVELGQDVHIGRISRGCYQRRRCGRLRRRLSTQIRGRRATF